MSIGTDSLLVLLESVMEKMRVDKGKAAIWARRVEPMCLTTSSTLFDCWSTYTKAAAAGADAAQLEQLPWHTFGAVLAKKSMDVHKVARPVFMAAVERALERKFSVNTVRHALPGCSRGACPISSVHVGGDAARRRVRCAAASRGSASAPLHPREA